MSEKSLFMNHKLIKINTTATGDASTGPIIFTQKHRFCESRIPSFTGTFS